jgi:hypothetical protein
MRRVLVGRGGRVGQKEAGESVEEKYQIVDIQKKVGEDGRLSY